jgi:hypothetical protein
MRRIYLRNCKKLGVIFLALGSILILALIMPPIFWCFAIGVALICLGLALLRR